LENHKPNIALLKAHLLCKESITRFVSWVKHSPIKEVLGIEQPNTENLYSKVDFLEGGNFEVIENDIFEYWKNLEPTDNESFVLGVANTYHNVKHDSN